MIDPEQLVADYLDESLAESARTDLNVWLKADPANMSRFTDIVMFEQQIRDAARAQPEQLAATNFYTEISPPAKRSRWLERRPLAAAAAGLIFGMFCASVAWAIVTPRIQGPSLDFPVLDESFENPHVNWSAGFPTQPGEWRGERGQVVGANEEIQPKDGNYMLQLDPSADTTLSYLERVIDLQPYPLPEGNEMRQIEVTASFHAATIGARERYTLRVAAFSEALDQIQKLWVNVPWQEMDQRTLNLAKRGLSTPTDARGWQTVTVTVELPREARSLVISLGAGRFENPEIKTPHYVDDVRARILIGPRTPHPRRKRS